MESEEYGADSKAERSSKGIWFARIELLETMQRMGYDEMSENRALAINLSFTGVMCSSVHLLIRTAVIRLSAMFLARKEMINFSNRCLSGLWLAHLVSPMQLDLSIGFRSVAQSTSARPKDSAQVHQTLFLTRGWGLGTRLLHER